MEKNIQSYYNEGYFQIQRLNNLWFEANNASKAGDFSSWRWILDTVWRELSRDVLKINKNAGVDNIKWYKDTDYYQMYEYHQKEIKEHKADPENYYQALQDYEMFLRYLQDCFGKGGKYVDPDEHGID